MSLPVQLSWLRAWDFRLHSWDASLWRHEATSAVRDRSFLSPTSFIRRTLRINSGLVANIGKYFLAFVILLICNAVGNRLTFAHGGLSAPTTLVAVFVMAMLHGVMYSCMFVLSNGLVREQLSKAGVHDVLTSAFHFHPLWLISYSGETLRTKVIDTGLGSFANVLNRFAWYGPMIVSLIAAVMTVWTLSVPLCMSLVALAAGLEVVLLTPMKEKAEADRRAGTLARVRYAISEKLDFGRLSSARTRGPREYGSVVSRLVAYRQHYARVTYPGDAANAIAASLSCAGNELISLLLLWFVMTMPSTASGSDAASLASHTVPAPADGNFAAVTSWLFGRATSAPALTVSACIIAVRAVTKSLAKVLAQRKHTAEDLRQYVHASDILSTAFLPEDITEDFTAESSAAVGALASRISGALGDRASPVPVTISTPGGAITTINTGSVRAVVIKPFELRPGDITFVRGENGSGKVRRCFDVACSDSGCFVQLCL